MQRPWLKPLLAAYCAALTFLLLWVPWMFPSVNGRLFHLGHGWLWSGPHGDVFDFIGVPARAYQSARIDVTTLLLEIVALSAASLLCVFILDQVWVRMYNRRAAPTA